MGNKVEYCVMRHTGGSYWKVVGIEVVDAQGRVNHRKTTDDWIVAHINKRCLELENPEEKYAVMEAT